MISHTHKFVFVHIPKSAGTSICSFFINCGAYKHTGHYYQTHESVKDLEITNSDEMNKYFTFSFVRNPFRRLVSYYNFKKNTKYFPKEISFKEMCKKIYKKERTGIRDRNFLNHTRGCCDYLKNENGEININFIGNAENLQEDFNTICDKIGIPHQKLPHKNKSKHRHYTEYYDDETKEIVAEKYAKDIEQFGYKFGE